MLYIAIYIACATLQLQFGNNKLIFLSKSGCIGNEAIKDQVLVDQMGQLGQTVAALNQNC